MSHQTRLPEIVPSFGRGPAAGEKEGIRMLYVFWALLVLLIVVVFLWGFRRPPSVPSAPTLEAWQAALVRGDGNDWARLSDRDKMTLCLKAASELGKGEAEAWAYRDFLETFYRRPNPQTRGRPITETTAFCQLFIEKGDITLD